MRAAFSRSSGRRSVRFVLTAALVLGSAGTAALGSAAAQAADPPQATPAPSLRVFAPRSSVTLKVKPRQVVPLPVYVAAVGGTFDLRVQRADYASPLTMSQVVGSTRVPVDLTVPGFNGLRKFFSVVIKDADGDVVQRKMTAFCPNTYAPQRIDPEGPDVPTFPDSCYTSTPFTLGTVWGIDSGWATPAFADEYAFSLHRPAGTYSVRVSVRPRYRTAFAITEAAATTTLTVRLKKSSGGGGIHPVPEPTTGRRVAHQRQGQEEPTAAPVLTTPPASSLPDLRSLPAFGILMRHRKGHDWLSFGADVWVAGTSRLDIEGFRRSSEDVMDAYQYFYEGDEVVGKASVGTLEFDRRRGHHHWHLDQFARYRLLDADRSHIAKSKKQSFCIAPTDPVDLSLDQAERRPYATGLDSACGEEEALWIRETLPVGWGDTYYQSKGGQAFDVTDLPNGTYYISVEANPTGELFETDKTNNVALRKVVLKGRPGHRSVCVPGVFGLDAEGACA